jgi:hypothetical protein
MNRSQVADRRFWLRWDRAGALHSKTLAAPWLAARLDQSAELQLHHRSGGVHRLNRTIQLPGILRDYLKICKLSRFERRSGADPVRIDEEKIIGAIGDQLPEAPSRILFSVQDLPSGSTGLSQLVMFRPWAKYFTCFSLTLAPVLET